MSRYSGVFVCALCALLLVACSDKDEQSKTSSAASQDAKGPSTAAWKDYTFADNSFSLNVPIDPTCQDQDAGDGTKAHLCTTESETTGFLITYAEIPVKGKIDPKKLEGVYKGSMDGAAKNVQGELVSSEDVIVNGVKGKSYIIKTKDGTFKSRIFVHKGYLVTVGAMPKGDPEASKEDTEKALSSFGPKI